ncbi:MAG: carph-isopro domain-containing protein [Paracoccaceae bacterium]
MGGPRKIAAALKYPESTVRSWLVRGSIPDSEKPAVYVAARSMAADVQICDFFPDQSLVRLSDEDAA